MLKFSKKIAFGLDISDFSIETLELASKNSVNSFARIKLESGIVKDGFVPNREKLVKSLKKVIEAAGLNSRRAVVSLPESKIFVRIFQVPSNVRGQELRDLISHQAAKDISLESDKIYWDYEVISNKKEKEILYVGILKEIIDAYSDILNEVGIEPVAFEVESIALERALSQSRDFFSALKSENKPEEARSMLIVDIGSRTTNINIFDNEHNLRLSSVAPVAGSNFTKVLKDKLKISSKEAEKIKKVNGFNESKDKGKVADILKNEVKPIIENLKKSIELYEKPIGEIYLAGGSSVIPKIAEYFSASLEKEVNLGESFLAKELSIRGVKPVLFNTVVGLALRGLEKNPGKAGLNLLPGIKKTGEYKKKKRSWFKKFIFTLLTLVLVWFAYGFIFNNKIEEEPIKQDPPVVSEPVIEEPQEPVVTTTPEVIPEEPEKQTVTIVETGIGWLNVRQGPGTENEIITKIYPGESYELLDETEEWYQIELSDGEKGWIFSEYATKD